MSIEFLYFNIPLSLFPPIDNFFLPPYCLYFLQSYSLVHLKNIIIRYIYVENATAIPRQTTMPHLCG